MTLESIERKIIDYFNQEYEWTCKTLDQNIAEPWEIVANTKQRLLGVFDFCQALGLDYTFLNFIYNLNVQKIENLIK